MRLKFRECIVYHSNQCPQLSHPLGVTILGVLSRRPHLSIPTVHLCSTRVEFEFEFEFEVEVEFEV